MPSRTVARIELQRSAQGGATNPLSPARGCMVALGIAAVLWALALAWGWWVFQRLLGILGGEH